MWRGVLKRCALVARLAAEFCIELFVRVVRCHLQIPGYPTWEIDGEFHPGEMSLEELEDMLSIPRPHGETSTSTKDNEP